jgi:hypothetical protein
LNFPFSEECYYQPVAIRPVAPPYALLCPASGSSVCACIYCRIYCRIYGRIYARIVRLSVPILALRRTGCTIAAALAHASTSTFVAFALSLRICSRRRNQHECGCWRRFFFSAFLLATFHHAFVLTRIVLPIDAIFLIQFTLTLCYIITCSSSCRTSLSSSASGSRRALFVSSVHHSNAQGPTKLARELAQLTLLQCTSLRMLFRVQ